MVIPDLNHLLTDIVLGADAALGARPPGQKIRGVRVGPGLRHLGGAGSFHSLVAPGAWPTWPAPLGGPRGVPATSKSAC